jgi:hypothetical protein
MGLVEGGFTRRVYAGIVPRSKKCDKIGRVGNLLSRERSALVADLADGREIDYI